MITYIYNAKRVDGGAEVTAEVQAENEASAAKLLMGQGLFPVSITKKEDKGLLARTGVGNRVSAKDRIIFTRQLSTLITAGLPLTAALRSARDQISNKALREVVSQVVANVEGGATLSASLGKHPKIFNDIYISMIAAGEVSGSLDKSLERIANQQEKDAAIVSKIRGAMIYPVIVLVVIVLVLVYMLVSVLPLIANLYKDMNKELPLLTKGLVGMSSFIIHFWWLVLIALVGLGLALRNYLGTDAGQRLADGIKFKLPIFGPMFKKVYMARFARTLGTLLSTGIPMLEAMRIVRMSVGNVHVGEAVEKAAQQVKGGKALSAALEGNPYFTELVPQMIRIGEQSGAIDSMLDKVANYYETEVDDEVRNLSTTIEPILMVVLGVTVGGMLFAILYPVYALVGSGLSG